MVALKQAYWKAIKLAKDDLEREELRNLMINYYENGAGQKKLADKINEINMRGVQEDELEGGKYPVIQPLKKGPKAKAKKFKPTESNLTEEKVAPPSLSREIFGKNESNLIEEERARLNIIRLHGATITEKIKHDSPDRIQGFNQRKMKNMMQSGAYVCKGCKSVWAERRMARGCCGVEQ